MKCFSCLEEKETNVKAFYPYPEDGITDKFPIRQLLAIECQANEAQPDGGWDFRMAIVCHDCFHKLSPDMWISQRCWEVIDPKTPFDRLPNVLLGEEKWKIDNYSLLN